MGVNHSIINLHFQQISIKMPLPAWRYYEEELVYLFYLLTCITETPSSHLSVYQSWYLALIIITTTTKYCRK